VELQYRDNTTRTKQPRQLSTGINRTGITICTQVTQQVSFTTWKTSHHAPYTFHYTAASSICSTTPHNPPYPPQQVLDRSYHPIQHATQVTTPYNTLDIVSSIYSTTPHNPTYTPQQVLDRSYHPIQHTTQVTTPSNTLHNFPPHTSLYTSYHPLQHTTQVTTPCNTLHKLPPHTTHYTSYHYTQYPVNMPLPTSHTAVPLQQPTTFSAILYTCWYIASAQ
jgi:hypothetical protein